MACFTDFNVSQGSVATYARCDGMFNIRLISNILRNLPVKKIANRLRFDRIKVMSLVPFFGPPCIHSELTMFRYVIRSSRSWICCFSSLSHKPELRNAAAMSMQQTNHPHSLSRCRFQWAVSDDGSKLREINQPSRHHELQRKTQLQLQSKRAWLSSFR